MIAKVNRPILNKVTKAHKYRYRPPPNSKRRELKRSLHRSKQTIQLSAYWFVRIDILNNNVPPSSSQGLDRTIDLCVSRRASTKTIAPSPSKALQCKSFLPASLSPRTFILHTFNFAGIELSVFNGSRFMVKANRVVEMFHKSGKLQACC